MPSGTARGTASSTCLIAARVRADDGTGRGSSGSSSVFTEPPARSLGQPVKLCAMTRLVPAAAAAASRLSVPVVRSSLVTAKSRSRWRGARMSPSAVIWWMITSGAAARTAAITASRSSPSSTAGSAPAARSGAALPGVRVVAMTWRPAATSPGTRCRPSAPVAPVTKTRMMFSLRVNALPSKTRHHRIL